MQNEPVLTINDLRFHFHLEHKTVRAVNGVSYHLNVGKTLGLVGESGSGKSVCALSILRLNECPPGEVVSGEILFEDQDLLSLPEKQMMNIRGRLISMIFQEPMTSLNPLVSVGFQIKEVLKRHLDDRNLSLNDQAIEMLQKVGIPVPEKRVDAYAHELSGGMRQRVMIAMALACQPKVLIADEPTTALDVTIQAQILDLLRNLQEDMGLTILLITHDLGVIAEMADQVAVMYAGKIVEDADVDSIFQKPHHPYTKALLASIPTLHGEGKGKPLFELQGFVPDLSLKIKGCSFFERCASRLDHCHDHKPKKMQIGTNHSVSCWLYDHE